MDRSVRLGSTTWSHVVRKRLSKNAFTLTVSNIAGYALDVQCGWLVLALAGCRGILGLESPTRLQPDGTVDTSDTADTASLCFGSFTTVCFETRPQGTRVYANASAIDTDAPGECMPTTNGVDACVIASGTITFASGALVRGVGSKPLILVASDGSIVIEQGALLDVSSRRGAQKPGAGFGKGVCVLGTNPGPSGGGQGGSFGGKGGNGGSAGSGGGQAAASTTLGTTLRGGCAGADGGSGGPFGTGGSGGGAIEVIAPEIIVAGTINASGAGATAGGGSGNAAGGGGGSGGAIVLAAPDVTVTGIVFANGGGGGAGEEGTNGDDPVPPAAGQGGGGGIGGQGGNGSLGTDGASGTASGNGGGGGGGGAGVTHTTDPTPPIAGISPPFS